MSESIIGKVEEYLRTLLPPLGLELFDIQFRREGHGWVLRVFIDSPTGVTLDHCSEVSRDLGQYLDVEDLIDHAYNLEVSSPGLERPLRTPEEFKRFTGSKAKVKLHREMDGQKTFIGVIENIEDDVIRMELIEGGSIEVEFSMINKARLAL